MKLVLLSSVASASVQLQHSDPSSCFLKVAKRSRRVMSLEQNPGAGLGKIEPYDVINKDGFFKLKCIKDALFVHGDKFGDNKHEYQLGDKANVSIVQYKDVVPKEDVQEMTPTVCFNFCRTIPDMGYFGIIYGRECYCEPYFDQMASDSSGCEEVCPGDNTQTCGGKKKSDIFEMHFCNDGASVLAAAAVTSHNVRDAMETLWPKAKKAARGKDELSVDFQAKFGQAGDPDAAALMQVAKVAAGKLLHLAEDVTELSATLKGPIDSAVELSGLDMSAADNAKAVEGKGKGDLTTFVSELLNAKKAQAFTNFKVAKKGDDLVAKLKELTPKAEKLLADLQALYLLSEPMVNPAFMVRSGPCVADEDGCVMSGGFGTVGYARHEACTIEVIGGEVNLEVKEFNTESYFDSITINGKYYSGSINGDIKHATVASGYMDWYSDDIIPDSGFKICGGHSGKAKEGEEEPDRGLQYYPIMYFVDKAQREFPSTCTGTVVGAPIYFKSYHSCAAACDAENQNCVGFSYFPTGPNKPNLCFLFSDFKNAQYYTGCDGGKPKKFLQTSFLQKGNSTLDQPLTEEPTHPVCVAKLSKFVGTTLKPNKKGTCKQCLKELTEAKRCWE